MTSESLTWLELSAPPAPPAKKPARTGQPPCPICGWPGQAGAETCPHCGYSPAGDQAANMLAALDIKLPPPELEIAPAPGRWFDGGAVDSPPFYHLRLQAEQLRVSAGFDRLICLDDVSVDHYPHQLEAALRALRDMHGRALLADEVGLGKTIEAGIVMKELIERGLIKSVLILTPASLTQQWQEEMQTKFHEEFVVLESLNQLPPTPAEIAAASCRWLISLDRAKLPRWAEPLLAREYDLLIVDEAHKLKNHRTRAYRFVNEIRKRYVLMLTATPVHNDLMELYNLITILRPGHLGTRRAFRQNFVASDPASALQPVHITIYSRRRATPDRYLEKSAPERLAYRQDETKSGWLLKRSENLADLDGLNYLDRAGRKAAHKIRRLLAQDYEVIDFEAVEYTKHSFFREYTRADFVCRLKLRSQARRRRTTPRNSPALRGLLREVMIRNRRSSVGVRFPARQAAVYALDLTPPERELYGQVTTYIRRQLQAQSGRTQILDPETPAALPETLRAEPQDKASAVSLASETDPPQAQTTPAEKPARSSGPLRMTLMILQKQLCSSPQAAARTLKKLVDRQPDPQLTAYLILAWGIIQSRKIEATLALLQQYPGKFLIFTDYLPTLEALAAALKQAGYETVVFHGGMSAAERVETVRAFRKNPAIRVMISTQSGSEGHNLQFCHQLINFDLPWNPMRIEQRVGRLHRLGQQQTVSIFNLSANDTIEAYVLDLLAYKIRMFELVIGELDLILGELGDQHSFENYVERAWAGSQSEAELLQMMAELETILEQAEVTYQQVRSASDELSDLLDAYDEVIR